MCWTRAHTHISANARCLRYSATTHGKQHTNRLNGSLLYCGCMDLLRTNKKRCQLRFDLWWLKISFSISDMLSFFGTSYPFLVMVISYVPKCIRYIYTCHWTITFITNIKAIFELNEWIFFYAHPNPQLISTVNENDGHFFIHTINLLGYSHRENILEQNSIANVFYTWMVSIEPLRVMLWLIVNFDSSKSVRRRDTYNCFCILLTLNHFDCVRLYITRHCLWTGSRS